jgi:hypothetical protein
MMKHPMSEVADPYETRLVNSFFSGDLDLDIPVHIEPNEVGPDDHEILQRLLAAFDKAREAEARLGHALPQESLWEHIRGGAHGEAYRLLDAHEAGGLAPYFANCLRTPLCTGLGPGPGMFRRLADEATRPSVLLWIRDRMLSAALAVGAYRMENPEHPGFGQLMHTPLPTIVTRIEEVTGIPASRPAIMGLSGWAIGKGRVVDIKMPDDVYAVERVKSLVEPAHTIADLGGGFGGAALQFARSGIRTVMFDLPIMCVVQGYFLIKALGADAVSLLGEENGHSSIRVLPWWEFYDRSIQFDLVFNRDSMSEFHESTAIKYLAEIAERRIPFLSINHESGASFGPNKGNHIVVRELASQLQLKCSLRVPYWIRRGYVEEIFCRSPDQRNTRI